MEEGGKIQREHCCFFNSINNVDKCINKLIKEKKIINQQYNEGLSSMTDFTTLKF